MVSFTGSAGAVDGSGPDFVYEWSDVIVVIEDNVIVEYFTQFDGDALPNASTDVSIGNFTVQLTQSTYQNIGGAVGVNNLTLANGAQFDQLLGNFVVSGALVNNGLMNVYATMTITGSIENNNLMTVGLDDSNLRVLRLAPVAGDFTISGSGDIRLRDGFLTGQGGQSSITDLSISGRISGAGYIGSDFNRVAFPRDGGYLAITNTAAGVIEADVSGRTLTIQTELSSANPLVNAGLLVASNGGTLVISGGTVEQSGAGTIRAANGSVVSLDSVTVTGGTLDGAGSGVILAGGGSNSTRLVDLDISATGIVNPGRGMALQGTIENRGLFFADGFESTTRIDAGDVELTGGGTFQLVGNYGTSRIVGEAVGAVLTNADHTIRGKGEITGGNLTVINSGLISATSDAFSTTDGDVLTISGLAGLTNTGILEATAATTLSMTFMQGVNNAGGIIRAVGDGAVVGLREISILGGTYATTGTGAIRADGFNVRLSDFETMSGTNIYAGTMTFAGSITNRGTVFVDGTLRLDGAVQLSGGGTVQIRDSFNGSGLAGLTAGTVLTNLDTITGDGSISGGNLSLINAGLISARPDNLSLTDSDGLSFSGLAGLTNTGTIEATGGTSLSFTFMSEINNTGGTIRAVGDGSAVGFREIAVTGGTYSTTGTGAIRADGFNVRLSNFETLAGTNLYGGLMTFAGAVTNRGTVFVDGNLRFDGPIELSGGGTVLIRQTYNGSAIVGATAGTEIVNVDNTIRGDGFFGGGNLSLINSGAIIADADPFDAADGLAVYDLAAFSNTGVLSAINGATLVLNNPGTGALQNAGGTIRAAGAGSVVDLRNSVIAGGTLDAVDGGSFVLGRGAAFDGRVSQVTTNADLVINAGPFTLMGAIANSGDLTFSGFSGLFIGANTTLTGNGTITIGPSPHFSVTVFGGASGATLTNLGNTIGGTGSLGAGTGMILVNGPAGIVTANQAGNTLAVETGAIVTNNGVMSANGGILNVVDNVIGTGRLEVLNGGTLIVDQGTDQQVVFAGTAADTLSLLRREGNAGGFDFSISGMAVGDRIRLDVGAAAGQIADFSFAFTATGGTLSSSLFADSLAAPYLIQVTGAHSYGQFDLIGGADGAFGFVRVATRDGDAGNNTLTAAVGGERVIGLDGDDILIGRAGNDLLDGSRGSDTADYRFATSGVRVSLATTAAQAVGGGLGSDRLVFIENLTGSSYSDELTGNADNNNLSGGGGNDTLIGGAGADSLLGGAGNDTYIVTATAARVFETTTLTGATDAGGVDHVESSVSFSLDTSAGVRFVENLTLTGTDNITGTGNGLANRLTGNTGNNLLNGGDGTDTLNGGAGDDFIFGGSTTADLRDVVFGGDGRDSIDGGAGNDELNGGNGNDTVLGGAGADTLVGNADSDVLGGGAGGDLMSGNAGADTLNGGFGFDRINGGTGADQFFHQGVRDHGSDWIQDYDAAEGDVLTCGIAGATAGQFQVNFATTVGAGSASVQEAFVIYRPTGQVLWALVDGADDTAINLVIGGQVFDLV